MINLIKNELFKIFKKKGIYIILILLFLFLFLTNYVTNQSGKDYYNEYINNLKEEIKNYNIDNLTDDEGELTWYIGTLTQIETYELASNYDKKSWQYAVIMSDGYNNYRFLINENIYRYKNKEEEEILNKNYEDFKELLKGDWREYANKELETLKDNGSLNEIKMVELRLKYDIAYGQSKLNDALSTYVYTSEDNYNKKSTFEEKVNMQDSKKNYYISKYMVENHFDEPDNDTTWGELISLSSNTKLFIIVAVILIASSIMSEEFNKGTIKLLLVRPYNRTKIILSKFITVILMTVFVIISSYIMELIIGCLFFDFDSLSSNVLVYNYNTNNVYEISLFKNILIETLCNFPIYILLGTLAFCLSIIINNTGVCMAITLAGYIGSQIVNNLVIYFNVTNFKYFVTLNWDLNQFLYGRLYAFEGMTLMSALIISIIYFLVMLLPTLLYFNKKNIKNI